MDHGILFKPELVRKLAHKTETRRLVTPAPATVLTHVTQIGPRRWLWKHPNQWASCAMRQHYGEKGDRLWVRETWAEIPTDDGGQIVYFADYEKPPEGIKWRPGIHLARRHAKRWLQVIDVRPQRLLEIDDAGAEREGFANRADFLCAWDYINPKHPAHLNWWVWVIRFELER